MSGHGTRDYAFDNIRAVMLFLVAFGHTLDVYLSSGAIETDLMKYIYLFHMPMFSFITGYFTKDLEKAHKTAIEKCLIPYLLFQGVYILAAKGMIWAGAATFNSDVFNASLLLPSSAFYYLLAVFFWKLSAQVLFRLRHPLILSVIAALLVSLTPFSDWHTGRGAFFTLIPFFIAGVLCSRAQVERIRRMPKAAAFLIMVLGILPAVFLPYAIHSVRLTYADAGFTAVSGILYRCVFYLTAALMCAAIICLIPGKKLPISGIGQASIVVYAASTFLCPHAYIALRKVLLPELSRPVNMIGMIVFSGIVVWLFSLPVFTRIYQTVTQFLVRLFLTGTYNGTAGVSKQINKGKKK